MKIKTKLAYVLKRREASSRPLWKPLWDRYLLLILEQFSEIYAEFGISGILPRRVAVKCQPKIIVKPYYLSVPLKERLDSDERIAGFMTLNLSPESDELSIEINTECSLAEARLRQFLEVDFEESHLSVALDTLETLQSEDLIAAITLCEILFKQDELRRDAEKLSRPTWAG